MWVLEKFGRSVPTTAKYPWLTKSHTNNASDLRPKETKYNQIGWDQAWEWYDAYKSGAIPFLEYRIQIREKELEENEDNLRFNKAQVEKFGKNHTQIKLIKAYERDINAQRAEIAKLKSELESLKAKEMEKQPDLSLENENLRLKKEILEMELKLKETNKQR